MSFFDRMVRNVDLMPRLAKRLGIDWATRIETDPNAASQYRDAVMRCAQCPHDGACRAWIDRIDQAETPPEYCQNKALLHSFLDSP